MNVCVQPALIVQFVSGLQITDYFLWAVQRLYEKADDRYVEYLHASIHYVHDIDDISENRTGTRYTKKRPLTKAALQNRIDIIGNKLLPLVGKLSALV